MFSARRSAARRFTPLAAILAIGACTDLPTQPSEPQGPQELEAIYATHVPDSIASDCSVDVTDQLNAWIASVPDSSTLSFEPKACYNIDGGLWVIDRHGLTFEGNGATFQVFTRGEPTRSNWTIQGGSQIELRRMVVRGANPHAGIDPKAYDPEVEWQHAFRFDATQGAVLDSVEAYDVHGDFVEAQPDWQRVAWPGEPARDIIVINSHFERSGRMGLGLTHVDGFFMGNTHMGGVPMSAVDVELDSRESVGRNIHIIGNTFGATHHSIFSNIGQGGPETVNIVFTHNRMTAPAQTCQPPIVAHMPYEGEYRNSYVFANNHLVTAGAGIDLAQLKDVAVRDNEIQWVAGLGCGDNVGIKIRDTHGAVISGNRILDAPEQIIVDTLSTGIEIR